VEVVDVKANTLQMKPRGNLGTSHDSHLRVVVSVVTVLRVKVYELFL